ncbi:MAG TPA: periplasmic heavy metal sensor [Bacteroidota bacterium]|nr:periplasmic heavy metal sensor [Bacteroidota bacterium]
MKKFMVLAILLLASIAYSQPDPMQAPDKQKEKSFRTGEFGAVARLKLTDDQQKQFEGLTSVLMKKQIVLRSSVMSKRVDLHDFIREETPSKEKIEALQNEISKLQSEIKTNRTEFWFDVNRILKPEQQKEWKRMLLMRAEHRGMQRMKHGSFGKNRHFDKHGPSHQWGHHEQMDPHDKDQD